MSRIYSYVVEHDLGFAPNPFWGVCSLANCKPDIRKFADVGDLVIGTGSVNIQTCNRLVYWMRVSEILTFDSYWCDPRFTRKKPHMRGSMMHRYGDNIYWRGADGAYQQLDSFHSNDDGSLSVSNLNRDTGKTEKVLLGTDFVYFGKSAHAIPNELTFFVKKGPGHKCKFSVAQRAALEAWLAAIPYRGYVDEPGHW